MNQKPLLIGGLAITIVLVIAINVVSNMFLSGKRIDLTEEKLFTLTDGTRSIVNNLEEPITLRFYYSRKLAQEEAPGIVPYAIRVEEILQEYAALNPEKLRLEIIEPESFSEEEDEAALAGVEGVPINSAGDLLFLGLHGTNTIDDEEVIPFFRPEREAYLEYDLSELVYNLSVADKPTIGVITELPLSGSTDPMLQFTNPEAVQQPWAIYSQLTEMYEVREVRPVDPIDEEIDVLFVVHPRDLPDASLYHIEQFILAGGRAMIFVDPHAEIEQVPTDPNQPMAAMFASKESKLGKLADMLGVNMIPSQFVGDKENAQRIVIRNDRGLTEPVNYLGYVGLGPDNLADDVVTADLSSQMIFATAGEIFETGNADTNVIPLVYTSQQTDLLNVDDIKVQPNPAELLKQFESEDEVKNFAVRVTGSATSAFPGGLEGSESENHLDESDGDINVIVVSDVDMVYDRFWVQMQNFFGQRVMMQTADNGRFMMNSIENLTGNTDLISIRSRGVSTRPFTVVNELAKKAGEELQAREQELEDRISEINEELQAIQSETQGDTLAMTTELETRIEEAQQEYAEARRELRSVRQNLNKDVESLGSKLRLYNIILLPGLITLLAFIVGLVKAQKRRNALR